MYLAKHRKRILCVLLCAVTLTTSIFYVYKKPVEVKAVAVVDDIAILISILAGVGCTYYGTQVSNYTQNDIDNWDWGNLLDNPSADSDTWKNIDNWAEDSFNTNYNNWLKEKGYVDSEGNFTDSWNDLMNDDTKEDDTLDIFRDYNYSDNPNPDYDRNNNNSPFNKLKDFMKKNGGKLKIGVGTALAGVMGKFGYDMYQKQQQGNHLPDNISDSVSIPESVLNDPTMKYVYFIQTYSTIRGYVADKPIYSYFTEHGQFQYTISKFRVYYFDNSNSFGWRYADYSDNGGYTTTGNSLLYTNCTVYDSYDDMMYAIRNGTVPDIKKPGTINSDTLPFNTDTQDHIKNNPDSPTVPVAPNVTAPTLDDMKDFLKNLKDNPTNPQPIVNNFIQNITTNNTDPDPTPEPTPTPDSKPTPSPTPDVNPTPTPDTSVTPNPDDGSGDGTEEPELKPEQLEFDLKLIFPFCIPFDLIDFITVLDAEPVTPRFDCKMPVMSDKGIEMHDFTIDFAYFDSISELVRKLELLIFIIGLILATRHLIRG